MTDKSASLKLGDKTVDLSVKAGTIGPDDVNLFTVVDSAEEAWSVVREYYNLPEVGLG